MIVFILCFFIFIGCTSVQTSSDPNLQNDSIGIVVDENNDDSIIIDSIDELKDSIDSLMVTSCLQNGENSTNVTHKKYVPQIGDQWIYSVGWNASVITLKVSNIEDVKSNCEAILQIDASSDSIESQSFYVKYSNNDIEIADKYIIEVSSNYIQRIPFLQALKGGESEELFACKNGLELMIKLPLKKVYSLPIGFINYVYDCRLSGSSSWCEDNLIGFTSSRFDNSQYITSLEDCIEEYRQPYSYAYKYIGTLCPWNNSYISLYGSYVSTSIPVELLVDIRDSVNYEVRQINDQKWLVNDLKFSSEHLEHLVWTYESGYKSHYYSRQLASNGNSIQNICPLGWKIPTEQEWMSLLYAADTIQGLANALIGNGWELFTSQDLCGFSLWGLGFLENDSLIGYGKHVRYWVQSDSIAGRYIEIKHIGHRDFVAEFGTDSIGNTMNLVRCVQDD